jgi:glucose/arabinose dehydrogenase
MRRMAPLPIMLLTLACSGTEPVGGQVPSGLVPQDVVGHTLYLRPGFHVASYADVGGVRNIVLGPGGVVYAARENAGKVVRVVDANRDGIADSVVDAATGLNRPFGIAFRGDTMYVGETSEIVRFVPGATAPQVVVPNLPTGGHSTRTVVFGPDGLMYVSIGSSCNICDESDPRRAAVTRYNPDGSGEHRFATGLRNSVGLAFDPTTGTLWATNNDRDNLGDDKPPEHLNILQDGKWYGWPQCYLPGERNPEYPNADCSGVTPPAITFQAHSAPLGLAFYTGTAFPAAYQGDVFIAYHGSWNRSVPTGAKVVHVHVQNGRPVSIEDFVVGWQLPDGSRWGRPVAVLPMPDGSLLVSDDLGGKIWRITYSK